MSSKLNHKKRSRKTHGPVIFKSKDCAWHERDMLGRPIYKTHVKKY